MKDSALRLVVISLVMLACGCAPAGAQVSDGRRESIGRPAEVLCGLDVLKRDGFKQLAGRKIALITNHTGRDRQGNHILDLLLKAPGVKVVKIFSPEHGLYGNVDEKVGHTTEPKTGLRVYSLYGETRRPTTQMLEGADTLVFDIQDVGARFYTYSATLGNCMQEAGKRGMKFVVLDRPNPITGVMCDGPIADKEHFGFTAFGPMPVAHGMTFGELAKLYQREWGVKCELEVIKVEGWKRQMWWDETGLTWMNPSPNMRNLTQATLYPAVCLLEATNVSVGRGTDQPFELFGAPWIDGQKLSAELNARRLPGLRFVPIEFNPSSSKFKGEKCQGVYVIVTDRIAYQPVRSGVTMAWSLNKLYPGKFQVEKVVNLLQNKQALEAVKSAADPGKIENVWQADLAKFREMRKKYFLYK